MYRRTRKHPANKTNEIHSIPRQVPAMTMTVEEMADELHISRPNAYELVKSAPFPSFRIGKRILINRAGLQRWIDRQSETPIENVDVDAI